MNIEDALDGREELSAKPHIGKLTPRMVEALHALAQGNALDYTNTCVGRPTKQRLAKFGLAEYLPQTDSLLSKWDGPMVITERGRARLDAYRKVRP